MVWLVRNLAGVQRAVFFQSSLFALSKLRFLDQQPGSCADQGWNHSDAAAARLSLEHALGLRLELGPAVRNDFAADLLDAHGAGLWTLARDLERESDRSPVDRYGSGGYCGHARALDDPNALEPDPRMDR